MAVLTAALLLVIGQAQTASAAETAPSGYVKIVNQASSLCEGYLAPGLVASWGDSVGQDACQPVFSAFAPRLVWKFTRVADGPILNRGTGTFPRYMISNYDSGMCIDVKDGSKLDKAPIQQWNCNPNATGMIWALFPSSTGGVQIVNARSGKCLDDPYATTAPGVALWQYRCTAQNEAQAFSFTSAS